MGRTFFMMTLIIGPLKKLFYCYSPLFYLTVDFEQENSPL